MALDYLQGAVRLTPAAAFEDLVDSHGWGQSWRDAIFDYAPYHSRIHEVLGIARGSGQVRFGGANGRMWATLQPRTCIYIIFLYHPVWHI